MNPIQHRERDNGVCPTLVSVMDAWEVELSFPVLLCQAGRSTAYQNGLYAQGRTKPGHKVTNAKGEESPHCHNGAVDAMPVLSGGHIAWDANDPRWPECLEKLGQMATVAKRFGCAWGGDWKSFKDWDHFEAPNWRALPVVP